MEFVLKYSVAYEGDITISFNNLKEVKDWIEKNKSKYEYDLGNLGCYLVPTAQSIDLHKLMDQADIIEDGFTTKSQVSHHLNISPLSAETARSFMRDIAETLNTDSGDQVYDALEFLLDGHRTIMSQKSYDELVDWLTMNGSPRLYQLACGGLLHALKEIDRLDKKVAPQPTESPTPG